MLNYEFLGSGGVCPLPNRELTALYVQHQGTHLLVDCGESTQAAAKKYGISLFAIDAILITHLHADHILGLPGLLASLSNSGREQPLIIYGPNGLTAKLETMLQLVPQLPFPVKAVELKEGSTIQFPNLKITCFKLQHGILCYGYSFEVWKAPMYKEDIVKSIGLDKNIVAALQQGYEVSVDDILLNINTLFGEDRGQLKLVYATDTGACQNLITACANADVAILDGSYGEESQRAKTNDSSEDIHMTFEQAATVASEANAKHLILTHFSPSLVRPLDYLQNATSIFPNTVCAFGGLSNEETFKEASENKKLPRIIVSKEVLKAILMQGRGFVSLPNFLPKDSDICFLTDEDGHELRCQVIVQDNLQLTNSKGAKKSMPLAYVKSLRLMLNKK